MVTPAGSAGLTGCLEEMDRRGLIPDGCLAVCCVGPAARGWADEGGTYDFHVVSTGPWTGEGARALPVRLSPAEVPSLALSVAGRRWEITYWLEGQVRQVLAKVTRERFEGGGTAVGVLSDAEELFLERMSAPLALSGTEWAKECERRIGGSAFRALVTTRSLAAADRAIEDAGRRLAARDVPSAVLAARSALGHTVDALLESESDFGSRAPRRRARRLRETRPRALPFAEYWAMETMRSYDPARPEEWVTTVVQRCRDLAFEVEIS
ncbi:hypothetical protein GTY40_23395 [Streptomyces sp. SID8359]|uniref:hypothetical protein n=1 Tax=unclassified Streptomyces TaxID=2593676 RepID=UPI000491D501|nr:MULTISPECIES: hypothetical protein [unclassified Streptomyces]MYT93967.1 hypothetical protein [Streptomyces sp. SID8359]